MAAAVGRCEGQRAAHRRRRRAERRASTSSRPGVPLTAVFPLREPVRETSSAPVAVVAARNGVEKAVRS
jgi:hypothetical protein